MLDSSNSESLDLNETPEPRGGKIAAYIWEMVKVVIISLVIILPVRYFLIQPFYVKGASMEPNFHDHEYLIIDEISYRFRNPERGDIIVFRYPENPQQFFIKRVVGLPGERIKVENQHVYVAKDGVNFTEVPESYLSEGTPTLLPLRGYGDVTLRDNEYFVLGDNREKSWDSRGFGVVNRDLIIGRVWLRGWPLNKLTVFDTLNYNNSSL